MTLGSSQISAAKCKKKKKNLSLSVVELICCSLAILTALREIPRDEIHDTKSSNKNEKKRKKHNTIPRNI